MPFLLLSLLLAADPAPTTLSLKVGELDREALVYAPQNPPATGAPVVFGFHGHGGNARNAARQFAFQTHWPEAVVVYMQGIPTPGRLTDPEGRRNGWQHGPGDQEDRDLKFFDAVLAVIKARHKIDENRVYSTGHSNGGGFTYLLWSQRPDVFAAMAPSAAAARQIPTLKPKPAMHIAGENDPLVKYAWQVAAMETIKKVNGCAAEGQPWAKQCTLYPSVTGTPFVAFIHPGDHKYLAEAPPLIVKFFKEHARKPSATTSESTTSRKILIVVGPSTHPPGSHEVVAGARVLKRCLETASNVATRDVEIIDAWPADSSDLDGVDTVVFLGDQFPGARLPDSPRVMADLTRMMDRGCGMVCLHYATGLAADDVAEDGGHPLLQWTGGYFATKCRHHQSIAKIFPQATIEPAAADHPVNRGWRAFSIHDEPYIRNYFGKDGPVPNVTAIATALLPPEDPHRETVAWAVSRPDGGRGFGVVMPHFYRNWANPDLRRMILNAVVWTAKLDVPAGGVVSDVGDLMTFQPAALEPMARPAKK
jgi:predicted esterase/type 1 glutamine amidotransferase